eukprot:jgi/Hompol1/5628/HPOL_000866-RA
MESSHGIWLRDHCRCSECFHQVTKQRLVDTSQIPLDIVPQSATVSGNNLLVQWANPSHTSSYSLEWLRSHSYAPKCSQLQQPWQNTTVQPERTFWGASLIDALPTTPYDAIMQGDDGLRDWLNNIDRYGIGFVSGVPHNVTDTERLARRISFIRETHYGTFWDFAPDLEHGDTAYTTLALSAHTDTTYFTDPVGLQMFHLLEHRGKGGASLYVDGFHVARQLKAQSPWAYDALTRLKITAHSAGDETVLIQPTPTHFPIIKLDEQTGDPMQIRFNNDDRSTLDSLTGADVKLFYAALAEWTRLLRAPENELWVQLKAGTAVIMDNWRVLHGRSAFTGYRRLTGSYHNWDDFQSRLKMLCRPGAKERL